jgi:hypothetical protein
MLHPIGSTSILPTSVRDRHRDAACRRSTVTVYDRIQKGIDTSAGSLLPYRVHAAARAAGDRLPAQGIAEGHVVEHALPQWGHRFGHR